MQIIILAAGRGTRMGSLTNSVPKPMLEIKSKPLLAHKIEALPQEIEEVILVVGYLKEKIQEFFGDFYAGKKISYVEQKKLNGTGGALHLVKDLINDDFVVMNGDDLYLREDVSKLTKHELAILGLEIKNPRQFGVITVDENGNLKDVIEKPDIDGPALANIGLYKLNKKFFDYPLVSIGKGEFGLPQTLAQIAKDFPIVVEKAADWFAIGNPEDLERAQKIIDRFI